MKRHMLSMSGLMASLLGGMGLSHMIPQVGKAKSRTKGAGQRRAEERLGRKLMANEAIPSIDVMTRQRRRADERRAAKVAASKRKVDALKSKKKVVHQASIAKTGRADLVWLDEEGAIYK